MSFSHTPVLLKEVIQMLEPKDGGLYIDATFGAGGHSSALLEKANCFVYAIDRDNSVMPFVTELSNSYGDRFKFNIDKFSNITQVMSDHSVTEVDGIIFDLGISSMQIDNPARGFSFMHDGPLNMNMGENNILDASTIVNSFSESELSNAIYNLGGEKYSRRIAKALVMERDLKKIETTKELKEIIIKAIGGTSKYRDTIHPATRTFQALRILVNDELNEVELSIKQAINLLKVGGRMAVISFHSLEDGIVKRCFKPLTVRKKENRYSKDSKPNLGEKKFIYLHSGVMEPSIEEVKANPRSRSAKLRIIERKS